MTLQRGESHVPSRFSTSSNALLTDVSGGTARYGWVREFLKENLGREVKIMEPTKNLVIDPAVDREQLDKIAASLAIPIGLALESFN